MDLVRLQSIFIALSHDLFEMLSFGLGMPPASLVLIGGGALGGAGRRGAAAIAGCRCAAR